MNPPSRQRKSRIDPGRVRGFGLDQLRDIRRESRRQNRGGVIAPRHERKKRRRRFPKLLAADVLVDGVIHTFPTSARGMPESGRDLVLERRERRGLARHLRYVRLRRGATGDEDRAGGEKMELRRTEIVRNVRIVPEFVVAIERIVRGGRIEIRLDDPPAGLRQKDLQVGVLSSSPIERRRRCSWRRRRVDSTGGRNGGSPGSVSRRSL